MVLSQQLYGVVGCEDRRISAGDEFKPRKEPPPQSTLGPIERCRSIAIMDLDPSTIIDELVRVRAVTREAKEQIMGAGSREEQAAALMDYLADQPPSKVLRPYANALKKANPFLYYLLDIDEKKSAFTAHITEINLSKLSSLRGLPVLEDPENERRASEPAMPQSIHEICPSW